ncbi:MAG: carbon-nitrogen hydrolase family protein [Cyanobacteria bacterium P01_H01_bin.21]
MRICAAQTKPVKGDIDKNIALHKTFIASAVSKQADMIFFPELSVTGFEPTLAKELATTQDDERFDQFQTISDGSGITIGVGMPTKSNAGNLISMIIFQPHQPRQTYSKQLLHSDEVPYFICGQQELILTIKQEKLAPAICYESLQPEHAERAAGQGAQVYLASVAKPDCGVAKAFKHYPTIAKKYSMPVLMSNCVGPSDNFESVGQSAIWNQDGKLVGQLDSMAEGILLYDTNTGTVLIE